MSVKNVEEVMAGATGSGGALHTAGSLYSGGGLKELYHHVLSLPNEKWERIREIASQKGGNVPHPFHPNIREEPEKDIGKKMMYNFISTLHAPRIAARVLERHSNLDNEHGGHFGRELAHLMTSYEQ